MHPYDVKSADNTNHPPVVKSADEGTWRRIRRVEWGRTVAAEEVDTELPERLDTHEARSAILAWLVGGARAYLEHGLGKVPSKVLSATSGYRQESDHVGRWLAERCELVPSVEALSSVLYGSYVEWCREQGEPAKKKEALGQALSHRGIGRRGSHRGKMRTGIRLRVETAEDLPPNVVEFFRSSTRPETAPELNDGIDHGIEVDAILATMMED